ncbi:hypothetical protein BC937DRAFT_91382 [Endogone sp. FLAS-F59071]|nr:hypothetical protein BC937DRAFT_91382 [Endogone sp. FLAS-F59071]|eukprot:RUS21811.1 hypothetical protein BC937DRAFT_91382 [Endogone sp. FLAS-F59071]
MKANDTRSEMDALIAYTSAFRIQKNIPKEQEGVEQQVAFLFGLFALAARFDCVTRCKKLAGGLSWFQARFAYIFVDKLYEFAILILQLFLWVKPVVE